MPLDDPRLICPACGKLVEIEVERFEDMFEEPLAPGEQVAPVYHSECGPKTREDVLTWPVTATFRAHGELE
jgi:hypothetical protein